MVYFATPQPVGIFKLIPQIGKVDNAHAGLYLRTSDDRFKALVAALAVVANFRQFLGQQRPLSVMTS